MGSLQRYVGRSIVAWAAWAMLVEWAAAQGLPPTQNGAPCAECAQPPLCCPPLTPPSCRACGNSPQPDRELSPENWPPTCFDCEPCDPLKSACPDRNEFFILPPRPCLYIVADGAAIQRRPSRSVTFASEGLLPQTNPTLRRPADPVLATGDFHFDFAPAAHLVIGHTINECFQIEAVYTGVAESENSEEVFNDTPNSLGGVGNLFSPFSDFGLNSPINGLDYNHFAQIRYTSSLQSVELNVRRQVPLQPDRLALSILFGVRYFSMPEDFQYYTESDITAAGTVVPNGSQNTIHVTTNNQMVGPQIGALAEIYADNRWWVNLEAKLALLNNRSQQTTNYTNVNEGVAEEFTFGQGANHTAFAGDLALTFLYRWSPHFSTRLGYQALWLEGLALAPDNIDTNAYFLTHRPAQLNHLEGVLYHGPFAGVTLAW